jgi:hypothetical protein
MDTRVLSREDVCRCHSPGLGVCVFDGISGTHHVAEFISVRCHDGSLADEAGFYADGIHSARPLALADEDGRAGELTLRQDDSVDFLLAARPSD